MENQSMFENKKWSEEHSNPLETLQNFQKILDAPIESSVSPSDDPVVSAFLSSIVVFKNGERLTIANGGIFIDWVTWSISFVVAPRKDDVISCQYSYSADKLIEIKRPCKEKRIIKRPYYNKNRW